MRRKRRTLAGSRDLRRNPDIAISISSGGSLLHLGGSIAVGLMMLAVEGITLYIMRRFGK